MTNKLEISLNGNIYLEGKDVTNEAVDAVAQKLLLRNEKFTFRDTVSGLTYIMSVVEVEE